VINFILCLVFGALVGWLASIVMRTDARQAVLHNMVVGIIGALIGGLVFNFVGIGGSLNNNTFSLSGLVVAFVGATVLLAAVNLVWRGRPG
jgi:uncharacterized membrane protein YeaQ/YmgE (transglycosylase-associated protein family)